MAKHTAEGEAARKRVAKWIAIYRKHSGIDDDQDFATTLGIGKSTYSEIKSGKGSLGFDTFRLLRQRYKASLDDMLDRDPDARDEKTIRTFLSAQRSHDRAAGASPPPSCRRPCVVVGEDLPADVGNLIILAYHRLARRGDTPNNGDGNGAQ